MVLRILSVFILRLMVQRNVDVHLVSYYYSVSITLSQKVKLKESKAILLCIISEI